MGESIRSEIKYFVVEYKQHAQIVMIIKGRTTNVIKAKLITVITDNINNNKNNLI